MSSVTLDYWAPRQLLDYGLTPVAPLTDAGIEGITDEGTYGSKLFFRVAGAPPGDTPSSPVWDASTPGWLNTSGASTPVTFVGRSSDGAGSNTSNLTCEISGGAIQVISLTELESPTGGAYTMPAGAWTIRFLYRGSTATAAQLAGTKIVLVDRFTSGSTTYYGTNGASSTVHYSHTPSPLIAMSSNGTYTMSFTTSSSVAVSATQKLVVMTLVKNTNRGVNTITYRHNRNLLTPWLTRVISLDPIAVGLSAASASVTRAMAVASPAAVALAARASVTAISIAATKPAIVATAKPAIVSRVVAAGPANVAVAAVAATGNGIAQLTTPASTVTTSVSAQELTTAAHTAAKRSQCASIGGAIVRSPSAKPTPPRSPRSRGRTIASVTERSEVARSRTVPIPARTATSRFFVSGSGKARQRNADGGATVAIPNSDGPSLTNSSGVL